MTAVIFDLDGVLVESERHWQRAFADVANQQARDRGWVGPEVSAAEMATYTGGRVNETLRDIFTGIGHHEVAADKGLIDALTRRAIDQASAEFLADPEPIEASVEVAHELASSGIKLGVASSSAPEFIDAVLAYLGLATAVSVTQSALHLEKGKPDGTVYRLTLQRLGERAAECVAIEDSSVGVRAAADARLRCIGLFSGDAADRPPGFENCVVVTPRLTVDDVRAALAAADPY